MNNAKTYFLALLLLLTTIATSANIHAISGNTTATIAGCIVGALTPAAAIIFVNLKSLTKIEEDKVIDTVLPFSNRINKYLNSRDAPFIIVPSYTVIYALVGGCIANATYYLLTDAPEQMLA